MLTNPSSYRKMLRACLRPLVVTALDPGGPEVLMLDPELLWAARLDELEQVEFWTRGCDRAATSVGLGVAGEVRVCGSLTQKFKPGDVLSVVAYAYVLPDDKEAHLAHFVEVGPGNRAIEINSRPIRSQTIHPSYVLPDHDEEPWVALAMPAARSTASGGPSW